MTMRKKKRGIFYYLMPDKRERSVYEIDFKALYDKGYRGVIFDIDNTLVPHGAPADERSIELFRKLRAIGFKTCLVSNNVKARVDLFNKDVKTHYVFFAKKPMSGGYKRAMELMGTTRKNTLEIGAQIFTDVWGAKRLGIMCILTDPIDPVEAPHIKLKRMLENLILKRYNGE